MHYPGSLFVLATIILTVYGQIVIKWQVGGIDLPNAPIEKTLKVLSLFFNPWIISGFVSAFLASLFWMAAMTQLKLSQAYPFMSLAFVIVILLSNPLFGEALSPAKLIGTALLIVALALISR